MWAGRPVRNGFAILVLLSIPVQIPHLSSFKASTLYGANFHHLAVKMKIWLRSEDCLSGTTNKEDAQEHLGFLQTTK